MLQVLLFSFVTPVVGFINILGSGSNTKGPLLAPTRASLSWMTLKGAPNAKRSGVVSQSGVSYESVISGIDTLYPPQGLDERMALSRKDGYWPYISSGDEPPQELVYGEFDLEFFCQVLDRAGELLGLNGCYRDQVFCDLGSGAGRLILTAAALHPWKLCRGIELLRGIHDQAEEKLKACRRGASQSTNNNPDFSSTSCTNNDFANDPYWKQYQKYTLGDDCLNQLSNTLVDDATRETAGHETAGTKPPSEEVSSEIPQNDETTAYSLRTPEGSEIPLAPIDLRCGSFDDPYEFFGDSTIIFVYSSAMPYHVIDQLGRAVGRQCRPGTIVITTEYKLPLGGVVEPLKDDPEMPHGPYELEFVESLTGENDSTGGLSTVHFHRVIKSHGDGKPRQKPELPVSEVAYRVIQQLENGELNDPESFLRNVSNQMIFLGLPESWRPKLGTNNEN